MRWLRLLLLGLASVYPLYWTAQFVLFFLPETLIGFWVGEPVRVVSISYLQVKVSVQSTLGVPAYTEALVFAALFSMLILAFGGDRFLTGALAIVVLGQSALLPFVSLALSRDGTLPVAGTGAAAAFGLIVVGLFRILRRTGGADYLDRLALLTLLAVLPQAGLGVAFRIAYPNFDTRFLLMLLVPLYLGVVVAAALPARIPEPDFSSVPWSEILATTAAAGLLILAITLTSHSMGTLSSRGRLGGFRSGMVCAQHSPS
jgi:hypothetical protein